MARPRSGYLGTDRPNAIPPPSINATELPGPGEMLRSGISPGAAAADLTDAPAPNQFSDEATDSMGSEMASQVISDRLRQYMRRDASDVPDTEWPGVLRQLQEAYPDDQELQEAISSELDRKYPDPGARADTGPGVRMAGMSYTPDEGTY